jgi:predicted acylesterase/phospholipase RssA
MSSPAPPAPRAVHLILGAGGVRCLSHVGALRALRENGFEFASISACGKVSSVTAERR